MESILPNSPRLVELLCKIPQHSPTPNNTGANTNPNLSTHTNTNTNTSGGNNPNCAVNTKESHDIFQLARIIAIENNKYTNMTSTHITDESMSMSNTTNSSNSNATRGMSMSIDSNRTVSVDSTSSNGKNPQLLHSNYNIDNHKALHHWYSENGRELGFPSMRSISISFPSNTSTLIPYIDESEAEADASNRRGVHGPNGVSTNTNGVTASTGDGFCSNIFASPQSTTSSLHHLTEEYSSQAQTDQITTYDANTTVYHTIKSIHLNNNNGIDYNHYNNTLQVCYKYAEVEE